MTNSGSPLVPTSVVGVLSAAARAHPDREALVDEHRRLSYGDLAMQVEAVAATLHDLGVRPGDRVAAALPNGADIVVWFFGVLRIGGVWVGIHPSLTAPEKSWMFEDAGARLIVTDVAGGVDVGEGSIATVVVEPGRLPTGRRTGEAPAPHEPRRGEVAAIAYTSGTTGRPKGVAHDQHHMLLPGSVILHDRMGGRGERIGVHLPLSTLNLMILGPLLAFQGAGTCVCTDRRGASDLADWVADEAIEHLSTSPAIVHDLLADSGLDERAFASLRLGVGGAACPERLRAEYRERFGRDFTTGYGLSEAPTAVTQETESVLHVAGASGRPMAHVEVVIVDPDGRTLPVGSSGEICVAPAEHGSWAGEWTGMLGYWGRPEATAAARHGRMLRTGDAGHLDADGYLHVADRRRDLINRGGSNISPAEVARVLLGHPAVEDCIVLGRPHPRLGDEVVAAVQLRGGATGVPASELQRHCASDLASHKVPVEILVVDALPRNAMGKVVRDEVRSLFIGPAPDQKVVG